MVDQAFLDQGTSSADYRKAHFIILPVPYEATTTYGKGTKNGPAAIIAASKALESFDEELLFDAARKKGVYTGKKCSLEALKPRLGELLERGKLPVILGGEHSITAYAIEPFAKKYKNLSVLQLDAHADLRDTYYDSKYNHGCVMQRILEFCPAVQIGVRSISEAEYVNAKRSKQLDKIHFANKLPSTKKILNQLSEDVYITIDVDVFDPSLMPATGTPEPGGLGWYQVLNILKEVCAKKNVVGFDVVELSPRKGDNASDFTIAKLVYKVMGYLS